MSLVSQTVETDRIVAIIEPTVVAAGMALVRVAFRGAESPVLQVMVERVDGQELRLDDCAALSHDLSTVLDVADPIAGTYDLEVSSPGIDRPLTRRDDFARFAGNVAKVELQAPLDGRRRFRGVLQGVTDGQVRLATDQGEVDLPLDSIFKAKLVLTDELLAAAPSQPGD